MTREEYLKALIPPIDEARLYILKEHDKEQRAEIARLREALKSVIHTWDAYLSNPTGYPAYNKAKDALKETP